jgi:hypothetical protein
MVTRTRSLVVLTAFAASCACSDDTRSCTDEYAYGLSISVENSAGTPICDVTIRIQEGNYVEEKQLTQSDCILMGAGERAGSYRVTISRGDTVLAEDELTVRDDGCHPIRESLEVVLDE